MFRIWEGTDSASLENSLAVDLRTLLHDVEAGGDIPDTPYLRSVLSRLEAYLLAVLREVHAEWKHESLDGVFCELGRKTGDREVEFAGLCLLITDLTLTPYHVRVRLADEADEIEWLDCRLGEIRNGELVRIPYNAYAGGRLSVAGRLQSITWKYHVGFGTPTERADE